MAQSAYPFETSPATVDRWARMARRFAGLSGILTGAPGGADYGLSINGLTVSVTFAGTYSEAMVRGFVHRLDGAPVAFTLPANTTANPRSDRLVLRRDLAAQTVTIVRLQGTPAASPVSPALTRDDAGVWDEPLWNITVPANSGTVVTTYDARAWVTPSGDRHWFATGPNNRNHHHAAVGDPEVGRESILVDDAGAVHVWGGSLGWFVPGRWVEFGGGNGYSWPVPVTGTPQTFSPIAGATSMNSYVPVGRSMEAELTIPFVSLGLSSTLHVRLLAAGVATSLDGAVFQTGGSQGGGLPLTLAGHIIGTGALVTVTPQAWVSAGNATIGSMGTSASQVRMRYRIV